jgi:hypothetical protein
MPVGQLITERGAVCAAPLWLLRKQNNADFVGRALVAWIRKPHVAVGPRDDARRNVSRLEIDTRQERSRNGVEAADAGGQRLGEPEIAVGAYGQVVRITPGFPRDRELRGFAARNRADLPAGAARKPDVFRPDRFAMPTDCRRSQVSPADRTSTSSD